MLSSKESLKCIILGTNVDTYRSSIEEIDEAIETIEKDLEILEILKKHYDVNFLELSPNYFITYSVYKDDEDFKKVKEWLDE